MASSSYLTLLGHEHLCFPQCWTSLHWAQSCTLFSGATWTQNPSSWQSLEMLPPNATLVFPFISHVTYIYDLCSVGLTSPVLFLVLYAALAGNFPELRICPCCSGQGNDCIDSVDVFHGPQPPQQLQLIQTVSDRLVEQSLIFVSVLSNFQLP